MQGHRADFRAGTIIFAENDPPTTAFLIERGEVEVSTVQRGAPTILGQLVSTTRATALLTALIEAYGEEIAHPLTGLPVKLFPTPERLANAKLEEVRTTGMRKETIRTFARAVRAGEIGFSEAQDVEDPGDFQRQYVDERR